MSDDTQVVDRGDELDTVQDLAPETQQEDVVNETDDTSQESQQAETNEDDRPRDDKGRFIPKERFDEAVQKERVEKEAYQRRLKEFEDREAQRNVAANFAEANKAIKEMIKQHTSLLADGEIDKAADLMEQILELKEEISERKATAKAEIAKNQAKEEVRYDALVAKLESDYPQINPDAEEFDKTSVKRVQAYMTGLMQTERMSPSQALKEAVETLLGAAKKAPAKEQAEDLGMRRKEAAVKKALDAKGKQPASSKDVGIDHDKTGGALDASAIMKMSWDEFVKLPESKLSEMRGDLI